MLGWIADLFFGWIVGSLVGGLIGSVAAALLGMNNEQPLVTLSALIGVILMVRWLRLRRNRQPTQLPESN